MLQRERDPVHASKRRPSIYLAQQNMPSQFQYQGLTQFDSLFHEEIQSALRHSRQSAISANSIGARQSNPHQLVDVSGEAGNNRNLGWRNDLLSLGLLERN
jgi:hypothetical protein